MSKGPSKFEALQVAIKDYLQRFPRLTVKALSMRAGVPYATLRRIIQSEVNDIRDDTIFRIIDRVLTRNEQMDFIREHYPVLSRIMSEKNPGDSESGENNQLFKTFHRMCPHNLILRLALTRTGTLRTDIARLTGEYGLAALDEMMEAGLLTEEQGVIEISGEFPLELDETRHQIKKDLEYMQSHSKGWPGMVHHTLGSVTPEGLMLLLDSSRDLLRKVNQLVDGSQGRIPVHVDIIVGTYDPERVPIRYKERVVAENDGSESKAYESQSLRKSSAES